MFTILLLKENVTLEQKLWNTISWELKCQTVVTCKIYKEMNQTNFTVKNFILVILPEFCFYNINFLSTVTSNEHSYPCIATVFYWHNVQTVRRHYAFLQRQLKYFELFIVNLKQFLSSCFLLYLNAPLILYYTVSKICCFL